MYVCLLHPSKGHSQAVQPFLALWLLLPPGSPYMPSLHLFQSLHRFPILLALDFSETLIVCRGPQACNQAEALLSNSGRAQGNLYAIRTAQPPCQEPRIVSDHVLEETSSCHWVFRAQRKGNSAGGACERPNHKAQGSKGQELGSDLLLPGPHPQH